MKKIFTVFMAFLMLVSVFPLSVSAAKLGDVDGNGTLSAEDARLALRAAVGLEKLSAEMFLRADVDNNPGVDSADARLILRAAVGLTTLGELIETPEDLPYTTEGQTPSTAIPANGEYVIRFQQSAHTPERLVRVVLLSKIEGEAANKLAHDTNHCNDDDLEDGNKEWRFYLFDVEYISSSAGANDCMSASSLIYYDDFKTLTGGPTGASTLATLTHNYIGYNVFDVDYYPGSNGEVMIGIPISKGIGDLLLPVPNLDGNTWLRLDETFTSDFPESPKEIKPASPTGKTPDSPIPADGNTVITMDKNTRKIKIELTKILSGSEANQFAHDTNSGNDDELEDGLREWRFYYFNLTYLSSANGANDKLRASEVFFYPDFFSANAGPCHAGTCATLTRLEAGYGIFDVELYPGSSGKVVVGIPIRKGQGDLLLRVYNEKNVDTWVNLHLDGHIYEDSSSPADPSLPGSKPLSVEIPGALYGYNVLASFVKDNGTYMDGFYFYDRNTAYFESTVFYDTERQLITFYNKEKDGGECYITLPIDGGTAYVTGITPPAPGDGTVAEFVGTFTVKNYTVNTKINKHSVTYSNSSVLGQGFALMEVDLLPSSTVTNLFSLLKDKVHSITMKDIGFEALIK